MTPSLGCEILPNVDIVTPIQGILISSCLVQSGKLCFQKNIYFGALDSTNNNKVRDDSFTIDLICIMRIYIFINFLHILYTNSLLFMLVWWNVLNISMTKLIDAMFTKLSIFHCIDKLHNMNWVDSSIKNSQIIRFLRFQWHLVWILKNHLWKSSVSCIYHRTNVLVTFERYCPLKHDDCIISVNQLIRILIIYILNVLINNLNIISHTMFLYIKQNFSILFPRSATILNFE